MFNYTFGLQSLSHISKWPSFKMFYFILLILCQNSSIVNCQKGKSDMANGRRFVKAREEVRSSRGVSFTDTTARTAPVAAQNKNNNNNNNKKEISRNPFLTTYSYLPHKPPPHVFSRTLSISPVALPYSFQFIFCHFPAAHTFTPSHSFGHSSLSLTG